MARIIYASATEHINKYLYDVMVQPHFAGMHREVEMGIFKAPIYEAFDYRIKQRSKIPISKMVELFISKSSFDITNDEDVLDILHHIDAYVEEVYHMRSEDVIQKYIEKILQLRERIYFLFRRVLNKHPKWKDAYQEQIGIFQVLSLLYKPLGVTIDLPNALLDELQICPTVRRQSQKDAVVAQTGTTGQVIYDL